MNYVMTTSKRARLALTLAGIGSLIGCSGQADTASTPTPAETSSAELTTTTELPEIFGGGTELAAFAPNGEPKAPHAYGVLGPDPGPAGAPDEQEADAGQDEADPQFTIDLTKYAPAVGNQGGFSDCIAWAEGHSTMGWWDNKVGRIGNPLAPLFLYSLVNGGSCKDGTTLETTLGIVRSKGVDTHAEFPYASCRQPTGTQLAEAGHHRASDARSGWPLEQYYMCGPPRFPRECAYGHAASIWRTLRGGPIVIAINVYDNFENADFSHYVIGLPPQGSQSRGNHAVTIFKADAQGVWIQNQWGTGWGRNGWAVLTWPFIKSSHTFDAVQVTGIAPP